jgi:uncharacterized protein
VLAEVAAAGIEKPALIAAARLDEAMDVDVRRLREVLPDLPLVEVTVLDDSTLDVLRGALWRLTGLIRVFLRHGREVDAEPLALRPGATVADVADDIHHDLGTSFAGARVWGPSARFAGQRVGRTHVVEDGDVVEILRR